MTRALVQRTGLFLKRMCNSCPLSDEISPATQEASSGMSLLEMVVAMLA